MHARFLDRHSGLKDSLGIALFVILVIIGAVFINTFIFRSFNVQGRSMEDTMHDGDRLIVNRLPVTMSQIQNKPYVPKRGQIIIFKNPNYDEIENKEKYIVKRVIAFEGERVVLANGKYTIYNNEKPDGFDPDKICNCTPRSPTSGAVDTTVPDGTLFVSGDHRDGNNSLDSRNGLGFIPLFDVIGPVSLRIFPFNQIRTF
ncbi:signal peptidase I [Candidatus Saccharibacteria bacterium]|nr:signal peptidase I [Candidatus Saccharibacteria bacterium]